MLTLTDFLVRIPALLIAITFHEYAHARVAHELGDPTPRYQGRLSLNPLAHIDPIGLLMLWIFRFGWAKPVQVNPVYFRNRQQGTLYVSLAGPLTNVLIAFLALLTLRLNLFQYGSAGWALVQSILMYNAVLAVFNIIPVPPLDGSKILAGLLPRRQAHVIYEMERYGWIILILLVFSGAIGLILMPLVNVLVSVLDIIARLVTGAPTI